MINIDDFKLSMLLYADDIVLLACNETDMQKMLDKLHDWCKRWRVLINTNKPKVVDVRSDRRQRTSFQFKIGDNELEVTSHYKYLGVITRKGLHHTQKISQKVVGVHYEPLSQIRSFV